MRLYEIVTAVLGVGFLAWLGYGVIFEGSVPKPEYTVIKRYKDFESREYKPMLIAETTVIDQESGMNTGFRRLAAYIFGENTTQDKIEMTAPVISSEKIEMTAPVLAEGLSDTDNVAAKMAFVLPARFTMETVPKPIDKGIVLKELQLKKVAVRRFNGWARGETLEKQKAKLKKALKKEGLSWTGSFILAQYNSPWVFPLLRKNELMLRLD